MSPLDAALEEFGLPSHRQIEAARQEQEDRRVVQIAALEAYCEEMAGHSLGEVAQRRLRAAHRLLSELRR